MALQQFKVPVAANRRAGARCGTIERRSLEEIISLLPAGHYDTIAELGSGTCSLANHFFSGNPPTHFRRFESDALLLGNMPASTIAGPEKLSSAIFDPAQGLPLPNASQDLLLTAHYLEYLRMDELYMICHEARRTVKPGGTWALASLTLPANALLGLWQKLRHRGQALDIIHYISPEDWRTRVDKKFSRGGLASQVVLLERL